jgi:hypothetical protein
MVMKRVAPGEPVQKGRDFPGLFVWIIMRYWVYIIQSQSTSHYYCGHSGDVDRRLSQHNDPEYRLIRTTKIWKGPWKLVWTQECSSRFLSPGRRVHPIRHFDSHFPLEIIYLLIVEGGN